MAKQNQPALAPIEPTETAQSALDAARSQLASLQVERASIKENLEKAIAADDVPGAVALQNRFDELPHHIFSCECAIMKANIALAETRIVDDEAELPPLREAWEKAQEEHREATERLNKAHALFANSGENVKFEKSDLARMRRELQDKIAVRASEAARPVMRSRVAA